MQIYLCAGGRANDRARTGKLEITQLVVVVVAARDSAELLLLNRCHADIGRLYIR